MGDQLLYAYTLAERDKLAGVEVGAEVNPTASEIKTEYEGNADTNAFTDAEQTKLDGIEAGAQVNVPAEFLATAMFVKNANLAAGAYMVLGEVGTSDDDGFIIPIELSIESVTISRTDTDAADIEVLCDGVVKATVATSSINTVDTSMSVLCPAGSVIVVRNKAGSSTMSNVICVVWLKGSV